MIDTGDGQKIPLNYVAEIRSAMGPNTISRENVKRKIVISANVADRDLRSVVNDIQAQCGRTNQTAGRISHRIRRTIRKRTGSKPHAGTYFIHVHRGDIPAALP